MAAKELAMFRTEAVFIDRDGTIGEPGEMEYPSEFRAFSTVYADIGRLKALGIKAFAFTNQVCIARDKLAGHDFGKEFSEYGFDDWFICPHELHENCRCKKPGIGMLIKAMKKYDLDLSSCWVIGDRLTDIYAGKKAGCRTILVLTGWGKHYESGPERDFPDHIAQDFNQAVDLIINSEQVDQISDG